MDLLTAVEQIVDKAKGSGLSNEFYRKADRYIKYLSEVMDLTKEQSVMLALFIDNSDNTSISLSDIGKFIGCRNTRIIRYMAEIDVLEKREFVRCNREDKRMRYRVPIEVIEAFKNNKKYTPKDCSGLSCQELFGEIEDVFELRNNEELTYELTIEKIKHLFDCNSQLLYVQKVKSYNLYVDDEMLLIPFSHLFVNNHDDNIRFHDISFLFNKNRWNIVKTSLNNEINILQSAKMIEYTNSDGFVDRETFCMTAEAKRALFSELNIASMNQDKKRNDVIKAEEIAPRELVAL